MDDLTPLQMVLIGIAIIVVMYLGVAYYLTQYDRVPLSEWVTATRISSYINPAHYKGKVYYDEEFMTVWTSGEAESKNLFIHSRDGDVICHHPWNIADNFKGACPTASSEARK